MTMIKYENAKARLENAKVKLEKAQKRLQRKMDQLEKLELYEVNGTLPKEYQTPEFKGQAERWLQINIQFATDEVKEANKKVSEATEKVKELTEKVEQLKVKNEDLKAVPEVLVKLQDELENSWNKTAFYQRDLYRSKCKEMGYKAFVKKYGYHAYEEKDLTDKQIKSKNKVAAQGYIIDLVGRVKKKVGIITDYSGIRLDSNGKSLNGTVKGTNGTAYVETIIAGGWNIQRLHLRTIVK